MSLTTITASAGERLAAAPFERVRDAFRESGFVMLRGFGATAEEFDAFTKPFTRAYFYGYGRAPFAGHPAITTVNESQLALEPHCDNGIRPERMRPEITWFWCERPAARAGETTLYDGVEVWRAMAPRAREVFETRSIVFVSRVAEPAWRALGHATPDSFRAFLGSIGARARGVDPDGTVHVEVAAAPIRTPRWTAQTSFVSSMLVAGSRGFEAMAVTLDDGSPIPSWIYDDVRAALATCLQEVQWQAGDVALLDNTRFLHGRRAYDDPGRKLFLIQTLQASF